MIKKTGFVWVILIIGFVGLLITLTTLVTSFEGNSIVLAMSVLGVIINTMFLYKLFKMHPSVIKWVNIAFGYAIIELLITSPVIYANSGGTNPTAAILAVSLTVVIYILIWVLFKKHLKRVLTSSI